MPEDVATASKDRKGARPRGPGSGDAAPTARRPSPPTQHWRRWRPRRPRAPVPGDAAVGCVRAELSLGGGRPATCPKRKAQVLTPRRICGGGEGLAKRKRAPRV